jgi:hypothetical protein
VSIVAEVNIIRMFWKERPLENANSRPRLAVMIRYKTRACLLVQGHPEEAAAIADELPFGRLNTVVVCETIAATPPRFLWKMTRLKFTSG